MVSRLNRPMPSKPELDGRTRAAKRWTSICAQVRGQMTKAGSEITPAHETQITLFATSCILAEDITANVLKGCRPSAKSLQRFNELASIQRRLLVSLGIFNRMSGDDNPEQELTEQQLDEMESLQEIIAKSFDISSGVTIEVSTANYRSTRGFSYCAVLCDELAFWRTEDTSVSPDYEVLQALRPGLSNLPGSMLLCASSPYAKRGVLFENFRDHYAVDHDPVLVWRAPSRTMHPNLSQRVVDAAMSKDPQSAKSEYMAEWRSDIGAFVPRELVERCVEPGRREAPPMRNAKYYAFVDPSGGVSDSFTLCVGHREGDTLLLDAIREHVPPFDPMTVVHEHALLLNTYGVKQVTGDRYSGEWSRSIYRKRGIDYKIADDSKSEIYLNMLPLLTSGTVVLLEHSKLVGQLASLERRTHRGGRDAIDHPPHQRDDVANAAAGVCWVLGQAAARGGIWTAGYDASGGAACLY